MCGRFTLSASPEVLVAELGLEEQPVALPPRYNIAPTQMVATVRRQAGGGRRLHLLRWGLIPSWATDPAIGNRLINARAETAAQKPAFRSAFKRRRCLVVADGFYEWQPRGRGRGKQPYLIRRRDGRPFAFAGLWERWSPAGSRAEGGTGHRRRAAASGLAKPRVVQSERSEVGRGSEAWQGPARRSTGEGELVESCTLITTEPCRLVADLHDRMPVILDPADYDLWLDPEEQDQARLCALLRPCPDEWLECYPVGPFVNDPRDDDPRCIERIDGDPDLFSLLR